MFKILGKSGLAVSGAVIIGLLLAAGLLAPWLAPHDPLHIDLGSRLKPPDRDYPLGSDQLGRCELSRLLYGARLSLSTGLAASALALGLGMALGLAAGMGGRRLEALLRGAMDVGLAFPSLILALALTGLMGPSPLSLALGVAAASWPWWARFVRGLTLTAGQREFVLGGAAAGVRGARLIRRYILPQIMPPILAAASLKTGWVILALSGLGYLGLGAQPPTPEWGAMLQESRLYMVKAPWLMLAPGAAVTLTVLGFNLLSEGLRDALEIRKAGQW